jgi:hypothetical protein
LRNSVGAAFGKHLQGIQELSNKTKHIPKSLKAGLEKSNATLESQFTQLGVVYDGTDPIPDAAKSF